ncbi:MAG TPA: response regulator [Stenotrophomonas sp.]|jgi:CheY-like chemotaxis protein
MESVQVLLVEDNTDLRKVVSEGLRLMGYSVTTAVDARDALVQLEEHCFEVVCTDVAMPNGMSGVDLVIKAQALRPGTRMILASGYPPSELGPLPEDVLFLGKPYRLAQLLQALESFGVVPMESKHRAL